MQPMSSPPSLLPSNRSAPSLWQRLLPGWRRWLLRLFLPLSAALALPSLGIGALIWWRSSKTWDYRERWAGTWVLALVGLVVYAVLTWAAHPLPTLFHALLTESRESILVGSLRAVGKL